MAEIGQRKGGATVAREPRDVGEVPRFTSGHLFQVAEHMQREGWETWRDNGIGYRSPQGRFPIAAL
eukprot:744219-Prorocentrum_minimum.AAC.6